MGGYMDVAAFKPKHSVLGPCPLHLSTFDLTKHGMIVSGHATASLPQIVLELDGDDIVATGVMGLFYGHHRNPSGA
jgi:arsenite oxidase small subunit